MLLSSKSELSCPGEGLNVQLLNTTPAVNPFGATAEELLAGVLDERGILLANSTINGISAQEYCKAYYLKRNCFEANTRIGKLLIQAGTIQSQQLTQALLTQREQANPLPLGEILVNMGCCSLESVENVLNHQTRLRESLTDWDSVKTEWEDKLKNILNDISLS